MAVGGHRRFYAPAGSSSRPLRGLSDGFQGAPLIGDRSNSSLSRGCSGNSSVKLETSSDSVP